MIDKLIGEVETAFNAERKTILIVSDDKNHRENLKYILRSELEKLSNDEFSLVVEEENGFRLYNGSLFLICESSNLRGLRADEVFLYEHDDDAIRYAGACVMGIKSKLHLG